MKNEEYSTLQSMIGPKGSVLAELPPHGEEIAFRDKEGNEVVLPAEDVAAFIFALAPVCGFVHTSLIRPIVAAEQPQPPPDKKRFWRGRRK